MLYNKIMLAFENCETATIPAEAVASFQLRDIRRTITNDWYSNNIHTIETSHSTVIILKPEANVETDLERRLFNRVLKHNDLVSLTYYPPFEEKEIYFHWSEDEYVNQYQTSLLTEDGYLIIVIDENKNANEVCEQIHMQKKDLETVRKELKKT